ncbi:MAG TPA: NUDIX domain-containing protein [Casimicrobiaceae bacterium]|jgi:predicted NUDIX family NTP pyrophosphohydrolase|nr:NUDIX domain-containing protein [Casimicrobiaceae bacterium]
MASRQSAGVLMFRRSASGLEVLLVHPGGPFWASKDDGAWSIPKGEFDPDEPPAAAARREFIEETGVDPGPDLLPLAVIAQSRAKTVHAFAVEGDLDPAAIASNVFEIEWPPRSGRRQAFPEIDRAQWFGLTEARRKVVAGQRPILDALAERFGRD